MRLLATLIVAFYVFNLIFEAGYIYKPKSTHPNEGFHRDGNNRTLILAHRGSRSLYAENTIEAFEIASLWADVLEFDVRLTADNKLVIFHDDSLDRTTDGKGYVKNYTLNQLKELDAGYKYSPFSLDPSFSNITDPVLKYPLRGKGLKIPTIEEYLERFKGVKTNIEIKDKDPLVPKLLFEKLSPYLDNPNLFVISSKWMNSLNLIRNISNFTIATSICEEEVVPFVITSFLSLNKLYHSFRPLKSSIHQVPTQVGISLSTPEYMKNAHDMGNHVHYWVVNTLNEMQRLLDLGVDALITDRADIARKVISRNESLSKCEDTVYRLEGEEDNILMQQRRNCFGKIFYKPKQDFIEVFNCNSFLCKYFYVIWSYISVIFYGFFSFLIYILVKPFFSNGKKKID